MKKAQYDEAVSNLDKIAQMFNSELARCAGLMPGAASNAQHHMATREFSVAATNMETAMLWAKAGLAK